jgi:transposase-like protein
MSHRIREAMRAGDLAPMGGVVEVDETYIGRIPNSGNPGGGVQHKMKVLSLVSRGTGEARSVVVSRVNVENVLPIVKANVAAEAHVMTDEHKVYKDLRTIFAAHSVVCHQRDEYVRGEAHTNTIEGFFSVFKRGMRGVYQFCSEKHLHRYLAEFDFRYTNRVGLGCNDSDRAETLLRGIVGKRLTYQTASARA